ncbi:hypothetical protein BC828DRAFT_24394 [Blastocladiella britannica]|nr:hypothetical protein BC828DRAFT_24394 [Blastocladiella britannica]
MSASQTAAAAAVAVTASASVAAAAMYHRNRNLAAPTVPPTGGATISIPATSPGESATIRHRVAAEGLVTQPPSSIEGFEITTLGDIFPYAKLHHPHRQALGRRKLVRLVKEEKIIEKVVGTEKISQKKEWTYYEMGQYEWMSAEDACDMAAKIGAGLRHLGVSGKLCISAATAREWTLVAHGAWSQDLVVTTAYDTLGAKGLLYSVNEAEVHAIFANGSAVKMLVDHILPHAPTLKTVIYDGDVDAAVVEKAKAAHPDVTIISLDNVTALGTLNPAERKQSKPEDLACIMYTSGSTGNPKGVELSHSNMVAAVAGAAVVVNAMLTDADVYLAYLPLAHVLELLIETYCIYRGVSLGYGSPKTLTDASMRHCHGDIKTLQPTVMVGVPAVWDSIKKGVEAKMRSMPRTIQAAFNAALSLKKMQIVKGSTYSFVPDSLVFNKVRQETGGRLRLAVSGGAPLSADTHLFISAVICPLIQGYGMTESSGLTAARTPEYSFLTKNVGGPLPSMELKLVSVPEAGYDATADPPCGEVWLRGPAVTRGYYKQPELTAEVLTADGWLRTGDIARMHPDGTFAIIDRAKNLIKLANAEYIALEKLESIYASCHYFARVAVYADPDRYHAICIANPNVPMLKTLAGSLGIDVNAVSVEEMCKTQAVRDAVVKDLAKIAKNNDLAAAEYMKAVILCDTEWTPQNELLTAAMKLQRRNIVAKYKADIEATYKAL